MPPPHHKRHAALCTDSADARAIACHFLFTMYKRAQSASPPNVRKTSKTVLARGLTARTPANTQSSNQPKCQHNAYVHTHKHRHHKHARRTHAKGRAVRQFETAQRRRRNSPENSINILAPVQFADWVGILSINLCNNASHFVHFHCITRAI